MPWFHLSTSVHILVLFLAGLGSGAAAMYAYRVTIPPLSPSVRILLAICRGCALFLLIVLITQPLLTLVTTSHLPPTTMVLVDNSRSMTIRDTQGDRRSRLLATLSSATIRSLSRIGAVRFALFDSRTKFLGNFSGDSLTATGEATNIAAALSSLKQLWLTDNVQSVLLLSDGNSTVGPNPVYAADELGLPVFAVGIGDTSEQKDLLISRVVTNEVVYAGSRVPVRALVHSSGFAGDRVEIVLRDSVAVLDRKNLTLETGTREYWIPLSFTPQREGLHRFSVEVSRLPGELSYKNNAASFFTRVLKSKLAVSLLASGPGLDVAFVRRAAELDQNFAVATHIESTGSQFYEGPMGSEELSSTDCILLVGFPERSSSLATVESVRRHAESGKPLFFLVSRTIDPAKAQQLAGILPVEVQEFTGEEHQAFVTVPAQERTHPLLKLSTWMPGSEVWTKLPPVFRTDALFRVRPGSEIVLTTHEASVPVDEPFVVTRSVDGRKSLAVLGYGLWRWNLFSEMPGTELQILEQFVGNAIRWLTTREDTRRMKVRPIKQIFTTQDRVDFAAEVYDESLQPVDEAHVQVFVHHDAIMDQTQLSPVGNGQYEGSFEQLSEGNYTYTASVEVGGKDLGHDSGTFAVGGSSAEFQVTKMNRVLLQQLSQRTGGKYYDVSDIDSLSGDIGGLPQFAERNVVTVSEFELWHSPWVLALVVLFLATEWIIRKRNGML